MAKKTKAELQAEKQAAAAQAELQAKIDALSNKIVALVAEKKQADYQAALNESKAVGDYDKGKSTKRPAKRHFDAHNPNYEIEELDEADQAAINDTITRGKRSDYHADSRVVFCRIHRMMHPLNECIYVKFSALQEPVFVCRDFAKKYGLQEYVVKEAKSTAHVTGDRPTEKVRPPVKEVTLAVVTIGRNFFSQIVETCSYEQFKKWPKAYELIGFVTKPRYTCILRTGQEHYCRMDVSKLDKHEREALLQNVPQIFLI